MPTVRGKTDVKNFIARIPKDLEEKVLRGAARAAATVVAEEAKDRTNSDEIRGAIKVATKREDGRMIAKVQVKGRGAYLAPWAEYGTAPHFISVDDSQRGGRSVARINQMVSEEGGNRSLVIGGNFVGSTVFHPGARPHPFLRPSLDLKEAEAIAAAQAYITTRVTRAGIVGGDEGDAE